MEMYVMSADEAVAVWNGQQLKILNEKLVPLYLSRTGNFEQWVAERAIDSVRPNSRVLKRAHGLSRLAGDFDTAMLYNAACITDNFWVRKEEQECWNDIRFTSDVYFYAAVSSDNDIFSRGASRSPELTNIGSREKGWKYEDGVWWLYKNEPEQSQKFELLTSLIGRSLGFPMAHYEIKEGFIRTRDVTGGSCNLQHADAIMYDHDAYKDDDLVYNYDTLMLIDPKLARQYLDIQYLDALVNNVDRHTKNYAFLTSQEDGHIISMAPNYDNDMAFYGYPAILSIPRNSGIITEFLKFIEARPDAGYAPPQLDENILIGLVADLGLPREVADYVLRGEALLLNAGIA